MLRTVHTLRWTALAAVCVTFVVNAQQLDERKALMQPDNVGELEQLRLRFQRAHDVNEHRIQTWLNANPTRQRTEVINNRTQTIVRIDEGGQPIYQVSRDGALASIANRNLASGQLIKANSLYSGGSIGANINGTGMVAGVWEPGLPRVTHELLIGKATVQSGQSGADDIGSLNHATHVTGTIVGSELASHPEARGIAYGASARNWDSVSDLVEMTQFATDGFLVSNHSYGDANTQTANLWKYGAYDTEAKDWDALTKAAPFYLPFIAIGNEQTTSGNAAKGGYDIVTGSAASKNVMVVGAVNADKTMSDYSNWGPTDDGRIKPEIVARGTGIDSAQATSDTAYSGSGSDSSGTSYAAPASAAAGLLLQQYYKSLHGRYMLSSTLKALMLGTAEDLGNPGPDHKFGWGLLNVESAANAIKKRSINPATTSSTGTYLAVDQRGAIIDEITSNPVASPFTEHVRTFNAKGGVPLVVNLGWTDDAGLEQTADDGIDSTVSRAVYDFDFLVRETSGNSEVRTWVIPDMANVTQNAIVSDAWFASSGSNFKQAIVPNPLAGGHYEVIIRKSDKSPVANRTLSLVVTGLIETQSYMITASAGANGTLTCADTHVSSSGTTICAATPIAGYRTTSISGCNGTATGVGVNSYTTGLVTANCTVVAAFEQFANASRLINIATRGQVQAGDNVMIGGFILQGTAPKTVLVRARGPSLTSLGVPGALPDPSLTLYSGQTVIASNDNWSSNDNVFAIVLTGNAPTNVLESAVLKTLNPGAYTAIVSGVGGGTGVGIVEVFEVDHPEVPLVNIATRGLVQTGDNVLIGGFIISGTAPQTVLIRARGPDLTNYGVPGALANPTLSLYSGQTVIASNDDWGTASNASEVRSSGLAPANALESAILTNLQPGAYTVIVSGVAGGMGVGIVEVFAR